MLWDEFRYRIRHFSADDQALIEKAFHLGEQAHEGQKRQSGEPYFTHPIAVAQILTEMGADTDTVIAALLHDVVEDTPITLEEIDREFNPTIAMLIDGVTKLNEQDIADRPTMDEQIETLRKMFTLMQKDIRIMVIKLADRLHNMQTIGFRPAEAQLAVAKETLDVYVKIADRLCMRDLRNELESLCFAVVDKDEYEKLMALCSENERIGADVIEIIRQQIKKKHPGFAVDMLFEKKRLTKLQMQFNIEGEMPSGVMGVNIVFVCDDIDDCYRTLGLLHTHWQREALTFEDHINRPIVNGYRAIHTTLILEDGARAHCKIRTKEMQEYAHRGIATLCFLPKTHKIQEYLPWTRNISPLSEDTEERSEDFWQSLQSDILGESMIIYGPAYQTEIVPKNATALDGALYLFRDKALYTEKIRVNGRIVPFNHVLERAASIDVIFAPEKTVQREWLHWAHTGIAVAQIRSALSSSPEEMIEIGKELLQLELNESGKGYVEEFNKNVVEKSLQAFGYASIEAAYIAIANGHVEPSVIARVITARKIDATRTLANAQTCNISLTIDQSLDILRRLTDTYERFGINMEQVHLEQKSDNSIRVRMVFHLPTEGQEALRQELIAIGARDVKVSIRMPVEMALMGIVVFFWALNPVVAKYFLGLGIHPLTLVSIRSIIFFLLSTIFFIVWKTFKGALFTPIQHAMRITFLPAVGTFLLSFLTYLSLTILPASVHLTILRFNVLILPVFHLIYRKNLQKRTMLSAVILFVVSIAFLLLPSTKLPAIGIMYAILALITYVYYSFITERALHVNRIGARYPYFLLNLGLIVGILGILALPLQWQYESVWAHYLPQIFLYVAACVFVPHTCFHIVLQRVRFTHVTGMSLFEVPLAILFEILLLGIVLQPMLYVLIGIILFGFVLLTQKRAAALINPLT